MKIALVGIGKIARDQHIPSIAASPDWELAAVVSRSGPVDGVETHATLDALLEARPDIGTISLTMPPQPRFAYARAALEAGRHVMLEKPPGMSLAECHALTGIAREKGVSLFATWHSRAAPAVPAAKDWLAGKTLKSLHITWKEDVRRWHPGQEWIWEPGGMGVFDPGINALSILTEILPVPVHVASATLEVPSNRQTPIAAQLTFAHPDGAAVTAEFDWRQEGPQTWQIEAETDAGTLLLTEGGARLRLAGQDITLPDVGEYPRLYSQMAELVAAGRSDVDLAPFVHVADAMMLGHRLAADAFEW